MSSKVKQRGNKNKKRARTSPSKPLHNAGCCFVIMPFGGLFDEYYDSVYRPAIEDVGLDPIRADDVYTSGTIIDDIWRHTGSARVILADLTERNSNVLYELGLAHALAKPVILTAQSIEDVPFDLRHLRIILYDRNKVKWDRTLRLNVRDYLRETLRSPKLAVPPTFLRVNPSARVTEVSGVEKAILEMRREVDLVRRELSYLRLTLKLVPIIDEPGRYVLTFDSEGKTPAVRVRKKSENSRSEKRRSS